MYKMWHWLPNLQLKKYNYFLFRLLVFSFLGHVFVLLVALCSRSHTNINLTVFAKPRGIEVVFMPLYKTSQTKFIEASPKSNDTKNNTKKISSKNDQKLAKPKTVVKAAVKKVEPKKIVPKKTDLKIKEPVFKIKPEAKPEVKKPIKTMPPVDLEKINVSPVLPDKPIYIGRQELKELQMFGELESVLTQNWQPPVGFGTEVECVVELISGANGEITSLVIKKSSGILAYDMSVRRNFNGMILPKSAINKTFTIVFRP
jgi:hypothetical protein